MNLMEKELIRFALLIYWQQETFAKFHDSISKHFARHLCRENLMVSS